MTEMTKESWQAWQAEWDSVNGGAQVEAKQQSEDFVPSYPELVRVNNPHADSYTYDYIRKEGNGTAKAAFFLIADGNQKYGFWVPRSAIVKVQGSKIEIRKWCTLKVIEYNRY